MGGGIRIVSRIHLTMGILGSDWLRHARTKPEVLAPQLPFGQFRCAALFYQMSQRNHQELGFLRPQELSVKSVLTPTFEIQSSPVSHDKPESKFRTYSPLLAHLTYQILKILCGKQGLNERKLESGLIFYYVYVTKHCQLQKLIRAQTYGAKAYGMRASRPSRRYSR